MRIGNLGLVELGDGLLKRLSRLPKSMLTVLGTLVPRVRQPRRYFGEST